MVTVAQLVRPANSAGCGAGKNMYYVYVLKSLKDNKLYTGFTSDLKKRLEYHNKGLNVSTKHRRPLKLIYYEAYINEKDARNREIFLKSGHGREVLKLQIKHYLLEDYSGDCSSTG